MIEEHIIKKNILTYEDNKIYPEKDTINKQDSEGCTLLINICKYSNNDNYKKIVTKIIRKGTNINIKNIYGRTALMELCANPNNNIKTIKRLIKAKANLNIQDNYGWTALMYACHYSTGDTNIEIIKELLKNNININIKDNDGYTALELACKCLYIERNIDIIIELLLYGTKYDNNVSKNNNDHIIDNIYKFYYNKINKIKSLINNEQKSERIQHITLKYYILKQLK